jgi:hypothetical protein
MAFGLMYAIFWALNFSLAFSAVTPLGYTVRNAPGASIADTYLAVRRAVSEAAAQKRNVNLKNSTTLDRSWDAAILLKLLVSDTPLVWSLADRTNMAQVNMNKLYNKTTLRRSQSRAGLK